MLNIFKPTSKDLMRVSLALRGLVGTISGISYIQNDVKLAFWLLVAGAVVEFFIQSLPPETKVKDGAKILVLLVSVALLWQTGCGVSRPAAGSVTITDSTQTNYKPVNVPVSGAIVHQSVNIDSLFKAWEGRFKQYLKDSTEAANSGKPIPPAPTPPDKTTVTDPQTKAQLTYWIDQLGRLQMSCESKDQTVQILVAENNRLRTEVKTDVQIEYKTPIWNYLLMGGLVIGLLLSLFKR